MQNLTDVDDDMLRRARELGEDYLALGNRNVTTFLTEMAALNWLPPGPLPAGDAAHPQMQELIGRLLERGHAYRAEGHVYFDVASWPQYGELSQLAARGDAADRQRARQLPRPARQARPARFRAVAAIGSGRAGLAVAVGAGRPGWHIECSAMSIAYLGPRFEIHGGGGDLVFPHHESEIAQSEARHRRAAVRRAGGCTPACCATTTRR